MLLKAEIQDCKARLNRLGITDEAQVKAVLDFCRSIALIAIEKYEEDSNKDRQDNTQGAEDRNHLDESQYQRASW